MLNGERLRDHAPEGHAEHMNGRVAEVFDEGEQQCAEVKNIILG